MENEILKLKITNESFNTEKIQNGIFQLYNSIIDHSKKHEVWSDSIKKIIITDTFSEDIKEQAEIWNFNTKISTEKEYAVVSKILFNHKLENPEHYIYFNFNWFYDDEFNHMEIALSQILRVYSYKIIPSEIREKYIKNYPSSLNEYIESASTEWCSAFYTRLLFNNFFPEPIFPINQNTFLTTFKRKLKRNLYEYNSDIYDNEKRLNIFWNNYYESFKTLFLRLAEKEITDENLKIKSDDPSRELVNNVVKEIEELTNNIIKDKKYNIYKLKQAILEFSKHFAVFLEDETEKNFRISLTKDPKDYFIDEIVETEPRIICFMDILGFSELINQYDSDISSTLLQDIQESFALAKTHLLENNLSGNKEVIKHLKYQTFSDNICISIPYFDNENDFISNFNLLSAYVRGFQSLMMTKGIFMRGGISIGSYYADNNIIFSKGLVNAYNLESKKAIYPRVIIDDIIINKLLKYDKKRLEEFSLYQMIIFDWENCAFLNPFNLIETSINQLESVMKEVNEEFEGDDEDQLTNVFTSLANSVKDMTVGLLKSFSENDKKILEPIKSEIIKNIYYYQNNSDVVSKYVWLNEFIKWLEKDETAKMKFETLGTKLITESNK